MDRIRKRFQHEQTFYNKTFWYVTWFSIYPSPVLGVIAVSDGAEPILSIGITYAYEFSVICGLIMYKFSQIRSHSTFVSPPQLPGEETLECRVRFVYERAASGLAKLHRVLECRRLLVVEDVAFAVVGSRTARWLIPKEYLMFKTTEG